MTSHMTMRRSSLVAVGVLLAVQSACGTSTSSPTLKASASPVPSEVASPTPEAATWSVGDLADPPTLLDPLPTGDVGDVGPLAASLYWGGEVRSGDGGRRGLTVGHLDGTHRLMIDLGDSPRWDGMEIISGTRQGVVLVAVQRQSAWGLQTIDVNRGMVRQIVEVGEDLWDAAIDPQAATAYWFVGGDEPTSGVWRMDLASGEIARVLAPDPVARAGAFALAAAVRPLGQLAVSDDGQMAVLECYHDCRLRIVDLATGEAQDVAAPAYVGQELLGFVPAGIAFWGGCVLLPGGRVSDERCPDPDGEEAALETMQAMGFHVELPAGWMLDVEPLPNAPVMSFGVTVVAVSEQTGDRIPLRAIGTVHGQ